MGRLLNRFAFGCIVLALIGCTRNLGDKASVSFNVPKTIKTQKPGALLTSDDLIVHVVVNVRGEGLSNVLVQNWDIEDECRSCNDDQLAALPAKRQYVFPDIPTGSKLIQVLLVTENFNTGTISFHYGDLQKALTGGENPITVTTKQVGGGSGREVKIAGRFLTAANAGPTARLVAKVKPDNGNPPMEIMRREMFGGWMELFAIDGANFTYTLENGTAVFSDVNATSFATTAARAIHVTSPAHFRQSSDEPDEQGTSDLIYGFFGAAGVDLSGHRVCYNASDNVVLANASLDLAGSQPFEWSGTTPSATDAHRIKGGLPNGNASCAVGSGTDYVNRLDFEHLALADHIEGAVRFRGPFKSMSSANGGYFNFADFTVSGSTATIDWDYLPGVFAGAGAIEGVTVFQRTVEQINAFDLFVDGHDINCGKLASIGYQSMGDFLGAANSSATISLLDINQPSDGPSGGNSRQIPGIVVCPFRTVAGTREYFNSAIEVNGGGGSGGPNAELKITAVGGGTAPNSMPINSCKDFQVEHHVNGTLTSVSGGNLNIQMNARTGLQLGTETMNFYEGAGCGGSLLGSSTTLSIPSGSSSMVFSFETDSNDYHFIDASAGGAQSASHEFGATNNTATQLALQTVFSMANNNCYKVKVKVQNAAGSPATNGANTYTMSISGGTLSGTFHLSPDCTDGSGSSVAFTASDTLKYVYFKPTNSGSASGTLQVSGGGLTSGSVGTISTDDPVLASFSISAHGPNADDIEPNGCTHLTISPVNSIGASFTSSSQINFSLSTTAGTFHHQGDCSDVAKTTASIFANKSSGFVFLKTAATEFSANATVDDGASHTGGKLLSLREAQGTPFSQQGFSKPVSLSSMSTTSGVLASSARNAPETFATGTLTGNLSADPNTSNAIFIYGSTFDLNSNTIVASGMDGTDGNGSSGGIGGFGGSAGGGGGGGSGTGGNGGTGNGGASPGDGGGPPPGGSGSGNGDNYSVGFSYGNGGFGGNGVTGVGGIGGNGFGGGGAGGDGGAAVGGGGGGAGGGLVVIVADRIIGSGVIDVSGGNGGSDSASGADGGSGGGGGIIWIAARSYSGGVTCNVSGGVGGPGNITNGNSGTSGAIQLYKIELDGSLTDMGTNCSTPW